MGALVGLGLSLCLAAASAATITVNTATDDFGAVPGNCSLREAIQSANNDSDFGGCTHTGFYGPAFIDVIELPTLAAGGAFTLTRFTGHDDANNSTDLDIDGSLRIVGVSAANSVIRADASASDSQRERVIHVLSGTVTLSNLTLRDGRVDNQRAGGGLRVESEATVVLNNVVVGANTADGNAGGILNRGTLTLNDSAVTNNQTLNAPDGGGGGGIFSSPGATLTLNDSRILDNIARGSGAVLGGGIFSVDTLTIDNCLIADNLATGSKSHGGGVASADGPFTMIQSTVSGNEIVGGGSGGGIDANGQSDIRSSLITDNISSGNSGAASGIGIDQGGGSLIDNVVSNNRDLQGNCARGGGLNLSNVQVLGTSIVGNRCAGSGGGVHLRGSSLVNSSILDNLATLEGGGIASTGTVLSEKELANVTVAGNFTNGIGGGIFNANGAGPMRIRNSVVADNQASANGTDCSGTITSRSNNLVQSTAGCTFVTEDGDVLNALAGLGASGDNGGPLVGTTLAPLTAMPTRVPVSASRLLDAGNPTGCVDAAGQPLSVDQLGRVRSADGPDPDDVPRCDIGAVEVASVTPPPVTVFRDGFE